MNGKIVIEICDDDIWISDPSGCHTENYGDGTYDESGITPESVGNCVADWIKDHMMKEEK